MHPLPYVKPPFVTLMRHLGLEPDPWQAEALEGGHHRLLLNCCRQAGKSTVVAILSLVEAVWNGGTLVLLLSRSHRQSAELYRLVLSYYQRLGSPILERKTADELCLKNGSRIVCLPCAEETIRGYSNVSLLVIDEAARVPDDLYRAVNPMLAVSDGRLICLSTPYGKRGFFYDAWARGGEDWHRIEVPAARIPRIKPRTLEAQRRALGESWYRQEFCCSFEALEGLVYPDFARCLVPSLPSPLRGEAAASAPPSPLGGEGSGVRGGRRYGGIDFGLRNPFAAVWGVLDRHDVLWIVGEHYSREQSLAYHAQQLPRGITWSADPEGAREIHELRLAGLNITKADNARKLGIAAVRARLESGRLRVLEGTCPNLLAEACLYRYDPDSASEEPIKEHDHTLDALRYLVSRVDTHHMARLRHGPAPTAPPCPAAAPAPPPAARPQRPWLSLYNEELWTRLD